MMSPGEVAVENDSNSVTHYFDTNDAKVQELNSKVTTALNHPLLILSTVWHLLPVNSWFQPLVSTSKFASSLTTNAHS